MERAKIDRTCSECKKRIRKGDLCEIVRVQVTFGPWKYAAHTSKIICKKCVDNSKEKK